MIKVGVIFGGESVEHEVSIISAIQAMNKMDSEKYEIVPIYITKDGEWFTGDFLKEVETFQDMSLIKKYAKNVILYRRNGSYVLQSKGFFRTIVKEIDIAFPIVHGTNVEDGVLQGYLKTIGIPFVGSDVCAAALGQDKIFQKQVWGSEGLPIPSYTWFFDSEYEENPEEVIKKVEKIKYPVIVKPATLGSSVGINVAHNKEELVKAIEDAITYDNKILVEEVINNLVEVNVSVVGNYDSQDTSVIEQVLTGNDLLTYEDKYVGGKKNGASKGMLSATRKIPADIGDKLTNEVKDVAVKAFKALNLSGDVRIDFLIDSKKKNVYINEVNTIPGSLAFYLWEPIGKDYTELLDELINIAVKDYKKRINKTHSFDSNILSGFAGGLKGAKGCKGVKSLK
jgi:D-alanine-D-alanine ligase